MAEQVHNEHFRTVSLGNRKSCPNCYAKLNGRSIFSWGEYVCASWRTVMHFCEDCFEENVQGPLVDHAEPCGCKIQLVSHCGPLPEWLKLPEAVCPTQ